MVYYEKITCKLTKACAAPNNTLCGATIKSKGACAQPCSPTLSLGADQMPMWQFPIFSLSILHTLQWDDWKLGRCTLSMVKEPYLDAEGSAVFVIDGGCVRHRRNGE